MLLEPIQPLRGNLLNDAASEAPRSWSRSGIGKRDTGEESKTPASQGKKRTFIQVCTCIKQKPKIMTRKNSAKIPMSPSVNIKKKVPENTPDKFDLSGTDNTKIGQESTFDEVDKASSPTLMTSQRPGSSSFKMKIVAKKRIPSGIPKSYSIKKEP